MCTTGQMWVFQRHYDGSGTLHELIGLEQMRCLSSVLKSHFAEINENSTNAEDWNPARSLHDSEPIFQVVENMFRAACLKCPRNS